MSFVFVDRAFAEGLKRRIAAGEGRYAQLKLELSLCADEYMKQGPWSVTDMTCPRSPGGPKDYYSEGSYWWPNPDDPNGPFVMRDGDVYPERFAGHKNSFREMSLAVLSLAYAGYYLDRAECAYRAARLLDTWFLDPVTGMNPHVEYGEAVRGVCTGKASGIIVVTSVDTCIHALGFLEACGGHERVMEGMRVWLSRLLHWLRHSEIGLSESQSRNNHGTWYLAHVMALAAYVGDTEQLDYACREFRRKVLTAQIAPDGSMPLELGRTRSLHYSLFNFEAATVACEAAYHCGIDLWNEKGEGGMGLADAARYVLPYYEDLFAWRSPQLVGDISMDEAFFQLLALRTGDGAFLAANAARGGNCLLYRNKTPLGPVCMLPGYPEEAMTDIQ